MSAVGPSSTRSATLVSSSRSSRARSWRDVLLTVDSRPASGDWLTENCMRSVGSPISRRGSASGASASAMVSPIDTLCRPDRYTISPADADSTDSRCSASTVSTVAMRSSFPEPVAVQHTTLCPGCTVPRWMRPSARRPLQLSWSRLLTSIWRGPSGSARGGGTCSRIASRSGSRVDARRGSRSAVAVPSRASV